MIRPRALVLAAAVFATAVLGACSRGDGDPSGAPTSTAPQEIGEPASPQPVDGAAPTATPTPLPSGAVAAAIPEAMRGRWGLVPADCTSTRGDAKGLMTVSADGLAFYESRGRLGAIAESAPDRLRASFAFTGEGMEWTREQQFELTDGGRALVRRESGEDAIPGPLTYRRC